MNSSYINKYVHSYSVDFILQPQYKTRQRLLSLILAVYLRRWSQGTIMVKFLRFLEFCKYGEKVKKLSVKTG